jgi:hypothetical protein
MKDITGASNIRFTEERIPARLGSYCQIGDEKQDAITINTIESFWECSIVPFIMHETLHEVLENLIDLHTSFLFDNIWAPCGYTQSLVEPDFWSFAPWWREKKK